MAIRIMATVWDRYPGGGTELLALLALADWSDDEGRCWPSIASIGKKTRLSRSQAQRVMHHLIDEGVVSVTGNETGGAPGSTRQYRINVDRLTGRMDATPTGSTGATGSAHATGRMDAQEGSHGCAETGSTHATQTVSEPSVNHQGTTRAISSPDPLTCPAEKIVEAYHRLMPDNPRCKSLNPARRGAIKARWNEAAKLTCKPFGYSTAQDGLKAWEEFFTVCANSAFLTGQAKPQPGKPPFFADIDFLFSPKGFAGCIENKYHRETA